MSAGSCSSRFFMVFRVWHALRSVSQGYKWAFYSSAACSSWRTVRPYFGYKCASSGGTAAWCLVIAPRGTGSWAGCPTEPAQGACAAEAASAISTTPAPFAGLYTFNFRPRTCSVALLVRYLVMGSQSGSRHTARLTARVALYLLCL